MNRNVIISPWINNKSIEDSASLLNFTWLLSLIRRLRPDLCKKFPLNNSDFGLKFLIWILNSGTHEYRAVVEHPAFKLFFSRHLHILGLTPLQALIYLQRDDVRNAYPLPEYTSEVIRWFYQHGVQEHNLWNCLLPDEWHNIPENIQRLAPQLVADKQVQEAHDQRPFGVNLIGYAYGQLGIGEDIRMTAQCMQAAKIPFTILNFLPGKDIPQQDFSMSAHVSETANFAVNIFCMTALETARYYAENGKEQFEGRYNIGYWPWELSKWPEEWMDLFCLVDEVWVSSRHTYDAVAPVSPVPVLIMPLAVELGPVSDKGRSDFNLPADAYLYCFSFDLNSSIHRKNPQACVTAFLNAFPRNTAQAKTRNDVGLVIKVHKPQQRHPEWERLKKLATKDDRIHIIEGTFSRPDLLALYKSCDCFLSLHRAEGFGRGIAEAILLGLRVITTGYSGNLDFCQAHPQVELVKYRLIPLSKGEYPFAADQHWAEVDIKHAILLMANTEINSATCSSLQNNEIMHMGTCFKQRLQNIKAILK